MSAPEISRRALLAGLGAAAVAPPLPAPPAASPAPVYGPVFFAVTPPVDPVRAGAVFFDVGKATLHFFDGSNWRAFAAIPAPEAEITIERPTC